MGGAGRNRLSPPFLFPEIHEISPFTSYIGVGRLSDRRQATKPERETNTMTTINKHASALMEAFNKLPVEKQHACLTWLSGERFDAEGAIALQQELIKRMKVALA